MGIFSTNYTVDISRDALENWCVREVRRIATSSDPEKAAKIKKIIQDLFIGLRSCDQSIARSILQRAIPRPSLSKINKWINQASRTMDSALQPITAAPQGTPITLGTGGGETLRIGYTGQPTLLQTAVSTVHTVTSNPIVRPIIHAVVQQAMQNCLSHFTGISPDVLDSLNNA